MNHRIFAVWPGRPYPWGANWDGNGVNFALSFAPGGRDPVRGGCD